MSPASAQRCRGTAAGDSFRIDEECQRGNEPRDQDGRSFSSTTDLVGGSGIHKRLRVTNRWRRSDLDLLLQVDLDLLLQVDLDLLLQADLDLLLQADLGI